MNARQRFLAIMRFEQPDRGYNWELPLWEQTFDRWYKEGMPRDVHIGDLMLGNEFFGLDRMGYLQLAPVTPMPEFEEEIFEEDDQYIVMRHANGIVTRLLKEGMSRGMRMSMDQYLSFPVTDRTSFNEMKKRFNPHSPRRYPPWWEDTCRCLRGRDYPLALTPNGAFGLYSLLRAWMGTENACTVFYDDPALAHDMLDFMVDYFFELIPRALEDVDADYFNFFEDFAYNAGPLIGPNIFRKFLLPRYKKITGLLRSKGIQHIWLDSDGNTEVLIPLFIEAGITTHWPLERASNMDPLKIRQTYGRDLCLAGGIDKRALAKGKRAIEEELYHHVPQLLESGGYIPTVDHAVPPDVSYENFLYYLELKKKLL